MMQTQWKPVNLVPIDAIAARLKTTLVGKSGVSLMRNGTMLFVTKGLDCIEDARRVLEDAKAFIDFRVVPLKEGDYFVVFHSAVAVFVGEQEFEQRRVEILSRIDELKLPSEQILNLAGAPADHYLIGLYGRGKLYRDIENFDFFSRVGGYS